MCDSVRLHYLLYLHLKIMRDIGTRAPRKNTQKRQRAERASVRSGRRATLLMEGPSDARLRELVR